MEKKKANRIFITGFLGSDRNSLAEKIAGKLGYRAMDLDAEIEKEDGRSIQRICMIMGEHEYRNKEYEMLEKLASVDSIVVSCGDGVLLDDMSREILSQNQVIIADAQLDPEELWEKVKTQKNLPYAFMQMDDDAVRKEKFMDLYWRRKELYDRFQGGFDYDIQS